MSYSDPYMQGFMQAISSETKGVFIRHLFVDINDGYLSDSIAFSHLCYMFSRLEDPDFSHRTLIQRDGYDWLALSHSDWWEACRINKNTIRTVIKRMAERGFILTDKGQTGTSKIVTVLIRPDFQVIASALQSAKPRSKRSDGSDRNDQRPRSKRSDGSDRNDQMGVIETIRSSLYIENIKEVDQESKKDPECARSKKNELSQFEPLAKGKEPIAASLVTDQTENILPVESRKTGVDKSSAPGSATVVQSAVVFSPEKVGLTRSGYEDMDLPGYDGFKRKYRTLCEMVGAFYGGDAPAREAWAVAWQGFEPPQEFWAGLDFYFQQQTEKFKRNGQVFGIFGGAKFISEQVWESALRINEFQKQASTYGVDVTNPESIRAANRRSVEQAASDEVRRRVEARRATNA